MKKVLQTLCILLLVLMLCACGEPDAGNPDIETCRHHYIVEIISEPSCNAEGVKSFFCDECAHEYTEPIKKLEHNYSSKVTTDSTCSAEGVKTFTCNNCGDSYTETLQKLNHNYSSKVTSEATCSMEGVRTFTCDSCGDSYTEAIPKADHNYSSKVTTKATCSAEGVKTFTCNDCGHSYTEAIKKAAHDYSSKVTTKATCTATGVKTFTCNDCGHSYTETIKKTDHNYSSKVTTKATCTATGVKTFTCNDCGHSYTETIAALGHNPDNDLICTRCGEKCPIKLDMNSTEKKNAGNVQWLSERQIWHQDDKGRYVLVFSLKDDDKKELYAPAVVEIRIENDMGQTVYTATKIVKSSDFQTWYYNNGTVEKFQATIYINDSEITPGSSSDGTIYFTIYNEGYFSFDESKLEIYDLPEKSADGKPIKWYKEGTYKVGVDIPAGEYYIKQTDDYMTYFAICSDSSGKNILENENFNNWHFVTVKNGQYLTVNRGKFAAVSSILMELDNQHLPEGMYRVGIDIPAGEYKLFCTGSNMGYLCVYDSSTADRDIITNDNFNNNQYITVKKGQYLQINRCYAQLISEAQDPPPGDNDGDGSGGNDSTGGNTGNPEDNLWSFTDASTLNDHAEKATDYMNKATNAYLKASSEGYVTKPIYYKQAISYVQQAETQLRYMKSLADSRATLDLKNSDYASLQEMITKTLERCAPLTSLNITSDNYTEYEELIRDEIMPIYTACLGIQNLSVELMKAFTQ